MKQHFAMHTYTRSKHIKEDDDLLLLISPFITAREIAVIDLLGYLLMFQFHI